MLPPPLALIVWVPPLVGQIVTPLALLEALDEAEFTNPVIVIASPVLAPELIFETIPATPTFARTTPWALVLEVGLWLYPRIETRPVALEMLAPAFTQTPAELAWLLACPRTTMSPEVDVILRLSVAIALLVPSRTPFT